MNKYPQKKLPVEIYRGGVTNCTHLGLETDDCLLIVKPDKNAMDFQLNLNSKGGGVTMVLLRVKQPQFVQLLDSMLEIGINRS